MNDPIKPLRSDDLIASLPAADQQQLRDWLSRFSARKVQRLAAQPRPEGLGLEASFMTFARFRDKERAAKLVTVSELGTGELLEQLREKARAEILDPDLPLSEQTHLAEHIFRLAALDHRRQRTQQHDREFELRRQSRELAAQRQQLEIVRTLRDHFPVLSKINWETETQDAQSLHRLKSLYGFTPSQSSAQTAETSHL